MSFSASDINDDYLIPTGTGNAVSRGWPNATSRKPHGVTWHWTATRDLALCTKILGGANPLRKRKASAHYGVGKTFSEGVHRYVKLENRSWHAGINQTITWDGIERLPDQPQLKASRTTVGVETVNIGFARNGFPAGDDWIECTSPNGRQNMMVEPWREEQIQMMIVVGKEIIARWPHIKPEDHHGHADICPGYKLDVVGFPFAQVLRGIYDDPSIADVWTPYLTSAQRQKALVDLGYNLGKSGPDNNGVDGHWGRMSTGALTDFQREVRLVRDGQWTGFVSREVYQQLNS